MIFFFPHVSTDDWDVMSCSTTSCCALLCHSCHMLVCCVALHVSFCIVWVCIVSCEVIRCGAMKSNIVFIVLPHAMPCCVAL